MDRAARAEDVRAFWPARCFHAALLISLALAMQATRSLSAFRGLTVYPSAAVKLETTEQADLRRELFSQRDRLEGETVLMPPELDEPELAELTPGPARSAVGARSPLGVEPLQLWQTDKSGVGGGLQGRTREARTLLARNRGGTPQSEAAVQRGLRWLRAQQHEDGSWSFDHREESSGTRYRNPGTEPSTTGRDGDGIVGLSRRGLHARRGRVPGSGRQRALLSKQSGVDHAAGR